MVYGIGVDSSLEYGPRWITVDAAAVVNFVPFVIFALQRVLLYMALNYLVNFFFHSVGHFTIL